MHEGDELFHVEINHVDKKKFITTKKKCSNQLNSGAFQMTKKKIFESIKSGGITNDEEKNI